MYFRDGKTVEQCCTGANETFVQVSEEIWQTYLYGLVPKTSVAGLAFALNAVVLFGFVRSQELRDQFLLQICMAIGDTLNALGQLSAGAYRITVVYRGTHQVRHFRGIQFVPPLYRVSQK